MKKGNGHDDVVELVNAKMRLEGKIQAGPARLARVQAALAEERAMLAAINDKLGRMEKDARR